MTYEVDGVQYVAVMTGAGSVNVADTATHRYGSHARVVVFALGGTLNDNGMASFADVLDAADADRIHQYVITRANKSREEAVEEAGEAAGQT